MKFLLLISFFCILMAASRASQEIGFYKDPKHPGKCVIRGVILSPGEELNKPCFRTICGNDGQATTSRCGALGAPPGHKLSEPTHPDAPYPDCCARNIIPE